MKPCPPFCRNYPIIRCDFVMPDGKSCNMLAKSRHLCSKHYKRFMVEMKRRIVIPIKSTETCQEIKDKLPLMLDEAQRNIK